MMMIAISSSSDVVMFGGSESVTLFGLFPPSDPIIPLYTSQI